MSITQLTDLIQSVALIILAFALMVRR